MNLFFTCFLHTTCFFPVNNIIINKILNLLNESIDKFNELNKTVRSPQDNNARKGKKDVLPNQDATVQRKVTRQISKQNYKTMVLILPKSP